MGTEMKIEKDRFQVEASIRELSEAYRAGGSDTTAMLERLHELEEFCSMPEEWLAGAEAYWLIGRSNAEFNRCLELALDAALDTEDLITCAETVRILTGRGEKFREIMRLAENNSNYTDDWLLCAAAYHRFHNTDRQIVVCLDQAEKQAACCVEFCRCAEACREWLTGEERQVQSLLTRAEENAFSINDLLECARTYHRLLPQNIRAFQLYHQALQRAEDTFDFDCCAEAGQQIGVPAASIDTALRSGRDAIETLDEQLSHAETVLDLRNDRRLAIDLLTEINPEAFSGHILVVLNAIRLWLKLDNPPEARALLPYLEDDQLRTLLLADFTVHGVQELYQIYAGQYNEFNDLLDENDLLPEEEEITMEELTRLLDDLEYSPCSSPKPIPPKRKSAKPRK